MSRVYLVTDEEGNYSFRARVGSPMKAAQAWARWMHRRHEPALERVACVSFETLRWRFSVTTEARPVFVASLLPEPGKRDVEAQG